MREFFLHWAFLFSFCSPVKLGKVDLGLFCKIPWKRDCWKWSWLISALRSAGYERHCTLDWLTNIGINLGRRTGKGISPRFPPIFWKIHVWGYFQWEIPVLWNVHRTDWKTINLPPPFYILKNEFLPFKFSWIDAVAHQNEP